MPKTAAKKPADLPIYEAKGVLTNIHPADELAAVREEIAILTKQADILRDRLLQEGASLEGDQYFAQITPSVRETLDRKAITEAFGEAAVAPFLKSTSFKTVKLVEKPRA